MTEHKAIPQGYMTIGEIAKKMDVTVRTLQYYDKDGLLPPSAESEGGRRLYTYKDIVKLHQIQSMKYLGFSLEDIKTRIPSINTPKEVSSLLTAQAKEIHEKIKSLKEVLASIEKLNKEVSQMDTVDWARYADIIVMLQAKNSGYWVMKYMSDNTIDNIRSRFGEGENDKMRSRYSQMMKKAAEMQKNGILPESAQGQALAKAWWDVLMEFTGGDMSLLSDLINMGEQLNENEWKDNFSFDKNFIERAMGAYITSIGYNLLDEETNT
ncbi:MAG: MerR family transcriptional regulator [Oscillospiraceae bacterium]|nr:MerR family transcriptional regulator [Oscillospiraceae bacterium]